VVTFMLDILGLRDYWYGYAWFGPGVKVEGRGVSGEDSFVVEQTGGTRVGRILQLVELL
jgi:hypothetical protein